MNETVRPVSRGREGEGKEVEEGRMRGREVDREVMGEEGGGGTGRGRGTREREEGMRGGRWKEGR